MPPPAARVRERTPDDLAGAAAALVEVHAGDGYPVEGVDDPVAWLTGPTLLRAWVLDLGHRIGGHVSISTPKPDDAAAAMWRTTEQGADEETAVLGRLFVVAAARRRRAGEQLMNAAQTYATTNGLRLVLDVMAKDAAAIKLYERLGWRRIGMTDHDDGHGDAVPAYCYTSPWPAAT